MVYNDLRAVSALRKSTAVNKASNITLDDIYKVISNESTKSELKSAISDKIDKAEYKPNKLKSLLVLYRKIDTAKSKNDCMELKKSKDVREIVEKIINRPLPHRETIRSMF
jgi:hydroxylamine reductase (hybrid-cluster protein)